MAKKPLVVPDRQSPLHNVAHPGRYGANTDTPGVDLSERLCDSLVQVQAWPRTLAKTKAAISKVLGVRPLDGAMSASKGGGIIMPTGPGRYLIEDESTDLETRLRNLIGTDIGAVTGLTHARVVVSIAGEKAEWVLSSLIAIEFSIDVFPLDHVVVSHHHEIGVTIRRVAENDFDLYVFTSYAHGFWHAVTTAAQEVGYSVS